MTTAVAGERPLARNGYLPIAEHGIVGDLHTAALVGTDGTIDWYCPERFDGPSVFAALLDRRHGGFYRIESTDPRAVTKQLYLPDTAVLITRFLSPDGVSEIQDFMPVESGPRRLIRRLVGVPAASSSAYRSSRASTTLGSRRPSSGRLPAPCSGRVMGKHTRHDLSRPEPTRVVAADGSTPP
ncbi:MAG TPA: trehalase-like domain-containing protein [Solirubrobacteraceae bacterium]